MSRGVAWVTNCDDGAVTVHARGELDVTTASLLRGAVLDAVQHAGQLGVAVDLSAVMFMDSVGLSALVAGFKAARSAGLPFTVVAASPSVARVLHTSGLGRIWNFPSAVSTSPTESSTELVR